MRIEKIFIILSTLFGLILIIITPPFQNPDEPEHFFRAYEISQGVFLSQPGDQGKRGIRVSRDLVDLANSFEQYLFYHPSRKTSITEITKALSVPQTSKSMVFFEFGNAKFYSPISYFPQALLILLGRQLPTPALSLLYIGRLASLGYWIFLIWVSLRLLPCKKWLFFYLALTPMAMAIGSAVSVDTVTNGLGFLWIALCLHFALDGSVGKLSNLQKILLVLIASCLGLAKQSAIPLVLCIFTIPKEKWGSWKSFLLWAFAIFVASLTSYFVWYLMVCDFTVPSLPNHPAPKEQLQYIITHPMAYISIFISKHLSAYFIGDMMTQYIGRLLGWLDVELPLAFVSIYAVLIFLLCFDTAQDAPHLNLSHRIVFISSWFVTIFLIATLLYLIWTPVAGRSIEGPMGRYYIMSGPAFFIAISGWLKTPFNVKQSAATVIAFLFGALTITVTVGSLIVRYY